MEKSSEGRPMARTVRAPVFSSRLLHFTVCLALFALSTFLAFRQAPRPDPLQAPATLTTGSAWRYPLERNGFKRLDYIDADLQDLFVRPDGRAVWVVSAGDIFHSPDGGQSWIPQPIAEEVPSGPKVPSPPGSFKLESSSRAEFLASAHAARLEQPNYPNQQLPEAQPNNMPAQMPLTQRVESPGRPRIWFDPPEYRQGWARLDAQILVGTGNGGQHWQRVTPKQWPAPPPLPADRETATSNLPPYGINAVAFTAQGRAGWAVGNGGQILHTANDGATWYPQTRGSGDQWTRLAFQPDGRLGWAVDTQGRLWRSDDGGRAWTVQARSENQALPAAVEAPGLEAKLRSAVSFSPEGGVRRQWQIDGGARLRFSDDDGRTWRELFHPALKRSTAILFLDDGRTGWLLGAGNTLLATRDSGLQWEEIARYRRLPAPWYFAALLLILLLLLPALQRPRPMTSAEQSVADMLASDRPLEAGDPDPLQFGAIAQGLSRFLRNENTEPPLTIAVTGKWGTGKSSLMNLLRDDLKRFGFRPVWFNAWHHQREENMLAALLENIQGQATPSKWLPVGWLFRLQVAALSGWRRMLPLMLVVGFAGIVLGYLWHTTERLDELPRQFASLLADGTTYQFTDEAVVLLAENLDPRRKELLEQQKGKALASKAEFLDQAATIVGDPLVFEKLQAQLLKSARQTQSFYVRWWDYFQERWKRLLAFVTTLATLLAGLRKWLTPFGVKPAELMASFSGRFNSTDAGAQLSFRQKYARQFAAVTEALRPRTMVVFVDDLDRCLPANILKVLEAVNYLVTSGRCFIILGMDMQWVERCVGLGFQEVAAEVIDAPPGKEAAASLVAGTRESDACRRPEDQARDKRLRFAHQYLEKLVNIEVPIPPLAPELSGRLIRPSDPPTESGWFQARRRALGRTLDFFRRLALPILALLLLLGVGIYAGGELSRPGAKGEAGVAEAVPAGTVQPGGSVAPERAAGAAPSGGFIAANAEGISGHFWLWPLLLLLAALAMILFQRPQVVVKDSPAFLEALEIWHPLVAAVHNTPRSIKRYMNRLRYFAMRLRPDRPERPWWRRLPGMPAPAAEGSAEQEILSEPNLVALAALYYFKPELIADEIFFLKQMDAAENVASESAKVLVPALETHRVRFRDWPPTHADRQRFAELTAQVRVL